MFLYSVIIIQYINYKPQILTTHIKKEIDKMV